LYSAIRRACHQPAKDDRADECESRDFRIEPPAAIPMSERLLIAVGHSKSAIPLPANPGQSDPGFERPFRIETGPG
jgi:hypothetical protein